MSRMMRITVGGGCCCCAASDGEDEEEAASATRPTPFFTVSLLSADRIVYYSGNGLRVLGIWGFFYLFEIEERLGFID